MDDDKNKPAEDPLENKSKGKDVIRAGMEVVGGALPFVGGFLSAAATAWSDKEQDRVNAFFKQWLKMLAEEMAEKEKTIYEIAARLDMQDENVRKRLESPEYQALLKKAFREWSAAESEEKRTLIRNILANAGATTIVSDDIVRLFLDWLRNYSELHFKVIGVLYNQNGITRGEMWTKLGRESVQEDSADADLFKLLVRDLSMGGVIRQHKETDHNGNFILERPSRRSSPGHGSRVAKSAFDETEQYELTKLGQQFVHYAMTDLPLKIEAPTSS